MKANSLLLAHLAKSTDGNAQQEAGDTRVLVPDSFVPTLGLVLPFFNLTTTPNVTDIVRTSIGLSDNRLFNAGVNIGLLVIGPGLWDIAYQHWIAPEGAVNDLTSNCRLTLTLNDGVGPTITLTARANTQLVPQSGGGTFRVLISSEQSLQFNIAIALGAGTGTNRSWLTLICSKLFP